MTMQRILPALLIGLYMTSAALAQPATAPSGSLLGPRFTSEASGISLAPPAGVRTLRPPVGSSEVVSFIDDDRKWIMKVSRVLLEAGKPLPLTTWKDAQGEHPGMLEMTIDQIKTDAPGAQILRQDTIQIADAAVGIMAAKFDFGQETNLTQEAVVRASDLQYYVVAMTSPAPRNGDITQDPKVRLAVEAFAQVVDSIQLIDQSTAREDRDARLLRTRTFYVNLTEPKLRQNLVKEQWLRVIRDGKDIGYTYVIQEIARDLPHKGKQDISTGPEGVLVGMRSRMLPKAGTQVDSESWYFCTFDRKREAFSTTSYTDDLQNGKSTISDLGVSTLRQRQVATAGGLNGKTQETTLDEYRLEVTKIGRNISSTPIQRDLPPYYLPQALGQLLPQLLERRDPRTYLFAAWVPDAGQVMYRYVDVGMEQDVTLLNRRVRAVPIKDRIGLEGSITTHYVSPEGQYLGSVNPDMHTTIVATDRATLEKQWQNSNFTRPGAIDGR